MVRRTPHERLAPPFDRPRASGRISIALLLGMLTMGLTACSTGGGGPPGSPTPQTTQASTASPSPTTPSAATAMPASPTPTATPTTVATPAAAEDPLGFPIDPTLRLGLVGGAMGSRTIRWGAGPEAQEFSRYDQPSDDPELANRSGWNCRVHVEYEGQPAVDWYIPVGTPVMATMDGTATLYAITVTNAFDYYGVDREPYIGNPDRTWASVSPFPGPSGGKGVFVRVENVEFSTDYAHLDLAQSLSVVPVETFLPNYTPDSDYAAVFAPMLAFNAATPIAQWPVRRGDLIGLSGDSGYSEAPHLHYTIRRADSPALLCPTEEAGFADGGWLMR